MTNIISSESKQENCEIRKNQVKVVEQLGTRWAPISDTDWCKLQQDYWNYLNTTLKPND